MTSLRHHGFQGVRLWYAFGIAGTLIGSVTTAAQPYLVGRVTDSFLDSGGFPAALLGALAAAFAADALASTSSRLLFGLASERFVLNLRNHLARRVLEAPYSKSSSYDRGDLNNRLVEDIPSAQQPYFSTYPDIVGSALVVIFCLSGMLVTSWPLTLGLLALLVVFGLLLLVVLRRLNQVAARSRVAEARYSSFLYEVLYNLMPLKALTAERWAAGELGARAGDARYLGNRLVGYSSLILPVVNIGTQLGLVGVLLAGGYMVTRGDLETSALVAYFLYLVYMVSPLVSLGIALGDLREADASWERLRTLESTLPPEPSPASPSPHALSPTRLATRDAAYTYPSGETIRVGDLTLTGPGTYCLVGDNGSGKSTLLSLLSALRLPTSGAVTWNDVAVSPQTALRVRQEVLLLTQERDALSVTVRDNICLGQAFSDEEILTLAERLGAQDFFISLPDGLDSVIGAEGVGLSGGQKQLLFVMHVLLRRPPVALLDEFSANLDARTKTLVSEEIARLADSSLVLLITHDETLLERFPSHVGLQRLAPESQEENTHADG
ncbi:ABC transporter ATP-binding protein [Actinomyces sp. 2119]|uniref:ABC transporter transmembrane domain-containing protein n=1 Tax=Actinomyces sp. 2119 TaxID=2321393 RepID=UPI000E6B6159|nr:ABC transporter ATP-binding protein [Actinomyces sp. 2119]RJF42483.1 ABC transporter ATP-binding protein [Actinomyces sp. 2119]